MPLLAVLNATAYPSAASVPIITLLYNGPLNCGFNVPIKGLKRHLDKPRLHVSLYYDNNGCVLKHDGNCPSDLLITVDEKQTELFAI